MYVLILVLLLLVVYLYFTNKKERYSIPNVSTNNWANLKNEVNSKYGSDAWQSIVNNSGSNSQLIASGLIPDSGSKTQLNTLYGGNTNDATDTIYCMTGGNGQECMISKIGHCAFNGASQPGKTNNCQACAANDSSWMATCNRMTGVWRNLQQAGL